MIRAAILCVGLSTAASAESLCGVTDPQVILGHLSGEWSLTGALSVELETLSVTQPVTGTASAQGADLTLQFPMETEAHTMNLRPAPDRRDVDWVDDILTTVEQDGIADDLSLTPCGPESLIQFIGSASTEDGRSQITTILPYFSDAMLMVQTGEWAGEWGLAFLTGAALMRPSSADIQNP
ncbi:hypothetical protein [Pseudooctadecabacter jejudonensis]|uniref:THAP4-like heme-binding beta-barrel domain-containing protein n=1 Tax=Pseudooctadecabacter jejudonensis TaxID=1391910 RepID=A0A1Y5R930_9RHOB|nr:hypothetical protein [Pseudooctadecabacter jejudonensis]SLN11609.1 hypothetical protein PSJ8397_00095 [Pseudooctadecabacter jejudonensis]